jgi:hypothetical protein
MLSPILEPLECESEPDPARNLSLTQLADLLARTSPRPSIAAMT